MHTILHVAAPAGPDGAASGNLPPAPGYYFILVAPKRGGGSRRRYFGPFATLAQARLMQKSALALGLRMTADTEIRVAEIEAAGYSAAR